MQFQCPHCGEYIFESVNGQAVMMTPLQRKILGVLKRAKVWVPTVAVAARIGRSKSTARQVLDRLHSRGKVECSQNGNQLEWRVP